MSHPSSSSSSSSSQRVRPAAWPHRALTNGRAGSKLIPLLRVLPFVAAGLYVISSLNTMPGDLDSMLPPSQLTIMVQEDDAHAQVMGALMTTTTTNPSLRRPGSFPTAAEESSSSSSSSMASEDGEREEEEEEEEHGQKWWQSREEREGTKRQQEEREREEEEEGSEEKEEEARQQQQQEEQREKRVQHRQKQKQQQPGEERSEKKLSPQQPQQQSRQQQQQQKGQRQQQDEKEEQQEEGNPFQDEKKVRKVEGVITSTSSASTSSTSSSSSTSSGTSRSGNSGSSSSRRGDVSFSDVQTVSQRRDGSSSYDKPSRVDGKRSTTKVRATGQHDKPPQKQRQQQQPPQQRPQPPRPKPKQQQQQQQQQQQPRQQQPQPGDLPTTNQGTTTTTTTTTTTDGEEEAEPVEVEEEQEVVMEEEEEETATKEGEKSNSDNHNSHTTTTNNNNNNNDNSHTATTNNNNKNRVAIVVSVTKDGPYMDGAAVLAHAVKRIADRSVYVYDLVALVSSQVTEKSRGPLRRSGWRVMEKGLPLSVSEIRGDYLREGIEGSGCCGASELLKLWAWTLTEYHRVLHLDMDSFVMSPMDELFGMDKDLVYTCDYGMMTEGSKACPVQGGFFVLRPSMTFFREMVEVVREGDFKDGHGWGDSNIGWFYGGQTIQGLLPYYFLTRRDPAMSVEVDRCTYNNMFDNPVCRKVEDRSVKNVHFTVCNKPWSCIRLSGDMERCNDFHDRWHEVRRELERAEGFGTGGDTESCDKDNKYHPIAYLDGSSETSSSDSKRERDDDGHHQRGKGEGGEEAGDEEAAIVGGEGGERAASAVE